MNFKTFFIGMILISLFSVSIIIFGNTLQADNDVNQTILTNPSLNSTSGKINQTIYSAHSSASSARSSFEQEQNPLEGVGELTFTSITTAGKNFGSLTIGMMNILFVFFSQSLGIPPIVLIALSLIIIVSILLMLWRAYKSGE